MPSQAYLLRQRVDEAFYTLLFPQGLPAPNDDLDNIEGFLQDMATRTFTYDLIKKAGEDPRNSLDKKKRSKIIKMMLKVGYSTDSTVRQIGADSFEVIITKCPICHGIKSEKPACNTFVGAIIGTAVICFKSQVNCVEKSCKSMGDSSCTFNVEFLDAKLEREKINPNLDHYVENSMIVGNAPISVESKDEDIQELQSEKST